MQVGPDRKGLTIQSGRSKSRFAIAALVTLCTALLGTVLWKPSVIFYGNFSASLPLGLYWKARDGPIKKGDLVAAHAPQDWVKLIGKRGYLPGSIPLLKRIKAKGGDEVCAFGSSLYVNGKWVAERLERDRQNRSLPWWTGCDVLDEGEFLLLGEGRYSFDGRYFGIVQQDNIIAKIIFVGWAGVEK